MNGQPQLDITAPLPLPPSRLVGTREQLADAIEEILEIIGYPYWSPLVFGTILTAASSSLNLIVRGRPMVVYGMTSAHINASGDWLPDMVTLKLQNQQTDALYNTNPYSLTTLAGSLATGTSSAALAQASRVSRFFVPWIMRDGQAVTVTATNNDAASTSICDVVFHGWRTDLRRLRAVAPNGKTRNQRIPDNAQVHFNPAYDYSHLPHARILLSLLLELRGSGLADNYFLRAKATSILTTAESSLTIAPSGHHFLITEINLIDSSIGYIALKVRHVDRNRDLIPSYVCGMSCFTPSGMSGPLPVPILLRDGQTLELRIKNLSGSTVDVCEFSAKGIRF